MAVGRVIDTVEQRRFESLKKLTAIVYGLLAASLLVGFAVLLGGLVWFVYRVVRGWLRLQDNRTPGVW